MLTGDKVETALNIAIATSLLTTSMQRSTYVWEELGSSKERIQRKLQQDIRAIAAERRRARDTKDVNALKPIERALVVDGDALSVLLEPELADQFAALSIACKVVICSRVTPFQKASFNKPHRGSNQQHRQQIANMDRIEGDGDRRERLTRV